MSGRTVFVIAHRLSTVRRADRMCAHNGTISDIGAHEELMQSGYVSRLYELQLRKRKKEVSSFKVARFSVVQARLQRLGPNAEFFLETLNSAPETWDIYDTSP